jgi:hypothetical protein
MPDFTILELLRDYRPPTKLHPLAGRAYDLYDAAEFQITDEVLEELRTALKGYDDLKDLTDALCGLSAFMIYLSEKREDEEGAERIAELIKEVGPRYEPLTEKVIAALQDLKALGKAAFDRFIARDDTEDRRAPVYGEKPPEGTLQVKDLKPPAQPPPWAAKKKR